MSTCEYIDNNSVKSSEIFHWVVSAVVSAAASWPMVVIPFRSKSTAIAVITPLVWCLSVPIVISVTEAPDAYISDNVTFLYIKLWSVAVGVSMSSFFRYASRRIIKNERTDKIARNVVISSVLAINILEASIKQLAFMDNPVIVDYINGSCGVLLVILTYTDTALRPIGVTETPDRIQLASNFGNGYIAAYTFWNILFVSRTAPEISFFMFLFVSHSVGIIAHIFSFGDWLDVRAQTLLFYIILKFGLTPKLRFFPELFAVSGSNEIVEFQKNDIYLYTMSGIVLLTTLITIGEQIAGLVAKKRVLPG